jgi:predicted transcriptional regulator
MRRAVARYSTATGAAAALGLTDCTLSRYLSSDRKPRGSLAESALRERIQRVLRGENIMYDLSSRKDAE